MPTITLEVPPSPKPTTVTVWVCCVCGRTATTSTPVTDADSLAEHFATLGWRMLRPDDQEPVCDRCKLHPDIAHILLAHEHVRGLQ